MTDAGDRMKIVVYYAVWTVLCAAAAGLAITLIHTWFFSYHPGRSAVIETLFSGSVAAVGLAAAQGAVALVTASLLAQLNRTLQYTVLLGLVIGLFDFVMYVLQMTVPATEFGWVPDVVIIVAVTAAITAAGSRRAAAAV